MNTDIVIMLVLDAFKGHLTPEIRAEITGSSMDTDTVVILGWMASQLQVLGVKVNKSFKHLLKQLYSEWLLTEDCAWTPTGIMKKPSVTFGSGS
jgi:DDE superfamily endonuclease.